MPTIQLTVKDAVFVDLHEKAEVLGLSVGQLAKGLCLAYLLKEEPTDQVLMRELRPSKKRRGWG